MKNIYSLKKPRLKAVAKGTPSSQLDYRVTLRVTESESGLVCLFMVNSKLGCVYTYDVPLDIGYITLDP